MNITFSYRFRNEVIESKATLFMHKHNVQYAVVLPDGSKVAITSFDYENMDRTYWVQANRLEEIIIPTALIQAMGEAMNDALREL